MELRPHADKYTRAIPAAARYESGMVYHREGAYWLNELEAELLAFPNGAHDDQVNVMLHVVMEIFSREETRRPSIGAWLVNKEE